MDMKYPNLGLFARLLPALQSVAGASDRSLGSVPSAYGDDALYGMANNYLDNYYAEMGIPRPDLAAATLDPAVLAAEAVDAEAPLNFRWKKSKHLSQMGTDEPDVEPEGYLDVDGDYGKRFRKSLYPSTNFGRSKRTKKQEEED